MELVLVETGLFPLPEREDKPLPLHLELPCSAPGAQNHSPLTPILLLPLKQDTPLQSPSAP